jgi:hypothetical protein
MRRLNVLLVDDDADAGALCGYMLALDKPTELARMREVIDAAVLGLSGYGFLAKT